MPPRGLAAGTIPATAAAMMDFVNPDTKAPERNSHVLPKNASGANFAVTTVSGASTPMPTRSNSLPKSTDPAPPAAMAIE